MCSLCCESIDSSRPQHDTVLQIDVDVPGQILSIVSRKAGSIPEPPACDTSSP